MPLEELIRSGTIRPIVRWGDPVMHAPTREVTDFGPSLQTLIADMFATNRAADGAGLAAPQIGVDLAVFVFDCFDSQLERRVGLVCNPTVAFAEQGQRHFVDLDEGCLSLPGAYASAVRPDFAACRGQDQFGDDLEVFGTGTLARCLQHETDHVNGLVFENRLPRRLRKLLHARHEQNAWRYPADWPVSRFE
ncbi:MAG TPA: peptide deformylase [Acidimicrobiales bacterium]|nr:peptide deformylase [Acidimicrobiales bacterium]